MMINIHLMKSEGDCSMINIEKIIIKGFKNIDSIDLQLNKITGLLSINNFGKSNVLNGIDFGIDFISQSEKIRGEMMRWRSGLPLNKSIKSKDFSFEIQFTTLINEKKYDVIYGYSFNWSTNKKKPGKIKSEYLKLKNISDTQKYTSYIRRDEKESYHKTSVTGSCDKTIIIGDQELIINKLKAFDSLFYIDIIKVINTLNIYIDRHFDSNDNYDMSPFVVKKDSDISLLHEDNIPRILHEIKEENPNKYERLINTFKDLFPFILDIEVRAYKIEPEKMVKGAPLDGSEPFELSDKLYYIFVRDKNLVQKIPFELMSDGAKRVLMILTYLTVADIHNFPLIAIEEPENSAHPRLLQQYLISLDSFLENSKIIITSHSPHLVNYISPNNLYLGIPNNDGLANFSKIKESSVSKLMNDSRDLLVGDYLFDLMSGTDEDIDMLSSYVE